MGTKEFKKEVKKNIERNLPYASRLQILENDLKLLQEKIITSTFFQGNRVNDTSNPTRQEIEDISKNNIEKAKEVGIQNPFIIFPHYLCQRFVETYIIIPYNIFKTLNKIVEGLNFSDEEKEKIKIVKERFEKEFDQNLRLVKYNLNSKEMKNLGDLNFLGINNNLLFNKNMQPEVLTLILDDDLLDKYDLVRNISDMIGNCPTLIVVNYILYPKDRDENLAEEFCLDGQNYQSLFALIKAVTINKNIKSFVFHSLKYYNLTLAPEICRLIEQKLQSETLVSFHFGNFNLNQKWIKKIEFLLSSTKSLLFLSYENKNYTKEDVLAFSRAIAKNRSIMLLSIITPIFKGMKKLVIQEIKQEYIKDNKDSKLEFIYLNHQSLINNSWFIPNSNNNISN